ncbi:hypothetical protein QUF58_07015 [Anaerolineales bacterium HSG24]|nr:hypothetical protein [Anaerolineales bacterium HSG24]
MAKKLTVLLDWFIKNQDDTSENNPFGPEMVRIEQELEVSIKAMLLEQCNTKPVNGCLLTEWQALLDLAA